MPEFISMSGESLFSFGYLEHIKWIFSDWIQNPGLILQSNACIDCPGFGMYSRWTMLWFYLLLLPGELLRLWPLVWYFFLAITIQYIGIVYFLNRLDLKLSKLQYVLITILYATIPFRYEQLIDQWEYAFVHFGFLLLYGTFIALIIKGRLQTKEKIAGFVSLWIFLTLGIGHLPLALYSCIVLTGIALVKHRHAKVKVIKNIFAFTIPALLVNSIMIASILTSSQIITKHAGVVGVTMLEALTFGYARIREFPKGIIQIPKILLISSLFYVATIVFSFLSKKRVGVILGLILCVVVLSYFMYGQPLLYMQKYLPFFNTMRASYRFFVFQEMLLLVIVAYVITSLKIEIKQRGYLFLSYSLLLFLFIPTIYFIAHNKNLINIKRVPAEYRKTYEYLQNNNERTVYFPARLPDYHGFTHDYSWPNKKAAVFFWWQNPFESWYPSRNVHHPTKHMLAGELNTKLFELYKENKQDEIIKLLRYTGVRYIIFDKYYKWEREMPKFNTGDFFSRKDVQLEKDFGELEIYKIN